MALNAKFSRVWLPYMTEMECKAVNDRGDMCFFGLMINFGEYGNISEQYQHSPTEKGDANIDLFDGTVLGYNPEIAPNSYLLGFYIDFVPLVDPVTGPTYLSNDVCGVTVQIIPNVVYKKRLLFGENLYEVICHNPSVGQDVLTFCYYNNLIHYPNYYKDPIWDGKKMWITTGYDGYCPQLLDYRPVFRMFKRNWYGNPYSIRSILPNDGRFIDLSDKPGDVLEIVSTYFELKKHSKQNHFNDGVKELLASVDWLQGSTSFNLCTSNNNPEDFYNDQISRMKFVADPDDHLQSPHYGLWNYLQFFTDLNGPVDSENVLTQKSLSTSEENEKEIKPKT